MCPVAHSPIRPVAQSPSGHSPIRPFFVPGLSSFHAAFADSGIQILAPGLVLALALVLVLVLVPILVLVLYWPICTHGRFSLARPGACCSQTGAE